MNHSTTNRIKTARFPVALIVVALASVAFTRTPLADDLSEEKAAAIGAIAEGWLKAGPIPGVSIAVARGGEVIFAQGYGLADIENQIPATAQTVYRIGSVTKQFTAFAIMQLVEQGSVSLDDDIRKHLPDYPTHRHPISVRQLLNHTSGVPSYTDIESEDRSAWRLHRTHGEMLAVFGDQPLGFAPGASWAYTNSGYYLLGIIIEKVTGQSYEDYVAEHLFKRAAMKASYYGGNDKLIPRRAQGYVVGPEGFANDEPLSMTTPYAAGALCSTVLDLVQWQQAVNEARVVTGASYRGMTAPSKLADGSALNYGFGLMIGAMAGHRKISHPGDINGFSAQLSYYPDDDLTVAVLSNRQSPYPTRIERQVAKIVLGVEEPALLDEPLAEGEAARLEGSYYFGELGIHITRNADKLLLAIDGFVPPVPIARQGERRYLLLGDPDNTVVFEPAAGARAERVILNFNNMAVPARRRP